jgi:hypothetical protein
MNRIGLSSFAPVYANQEQMARSPKNRCKAMASGNAESPGLSRGFRIGLELVD